MSNRILRLPRVKTETGLSRSTIYYLMTKGEFPKQVKLSARAVGWTEASINEWLDCRIAFSEE